MLFYQVKMLTNFPQLNGNRYTVCVTSKKRIAPVTRKLNNVTNSMNRIRLSIGNMNNANLEVPAKHRHNKHKTQVT